MMMKKHPHQFLQQLVLSSSSSSKATIVGDSGKVGGAMMMRQRRLLSNVSSYNSNVGGSGSLARRMGTLAASGSTAAKFGKQQPQQLPMRRWLNTSSSSSSSSSSPFSATQYIDSDDDDEQQHQLDGSFLKNQVIGHHNRIKRPSKMKPYPKSMKQHLHVPAYIKKPPYASSGIIPYNPTMYDTILIHDTDSIDKMFNAGQVARQVLENVACLNAKIGISTEEIDNIVHESFINHHNVYPSPLNYGQFPKSICSSINDVMVVVLVGLVFVGTKLNSKRGPAGPVQYKAIGRDKNRYVQKK